MCRSSVGRWAAWLLLGSYLVIDDVQGTSRPRIPFSYFCTFHGLPLASDEILISLHVGFTVMWPSGGHLAGCRPCTLVIGGAVAGN